MWNILWDPVSSTNTLQRGKKRNGGQIPCNITYMWNLKYDTNELIYKTETDSNIAYLWLPRGRWGKGGMDWEFRISRYKLLYTE